ncbi:MAG: pyridoxamine 5'-phosphate oxidase family protein [Pseudomonadota bacterium]
MSEVNTGWDRETSPFHSGERELQRRLGLEAEQDVIGRKIMRSYMPEQHRAFFNSLPFLVLGSVDRSGAPWASAVFGQPGFANSPNNKRLDIRGDIIAGDPLSDNITVGSPVSVVGVQLETRRRNRLNATVTAMGASGLELSVDMSFGNCPQYIQKRAHSFVERSADAKQEFTDLPKEARRIIRAADTLFVATHNPHDDQHDVGGVDVNHRGGRAGFVHVKRNCLTIPDFSGNSLFNSLGNMLVNPVAGLLFIDFETGDLLQVTGKTTLHWELTPELADFPGAERGWSVEVTHGHIIPNACPLVWEFQQLSPRLSGTGRWQD